MTTRTKTAFAAALLTVTAGCLHPAWAEDTTVTFKSLTPELALDAARAALNQCRTDGFQVSVAVVDRSGETQVLLRDRYAGLPANTTATNKAWTAVGFRSDTSELAASIKSGKLDPELARLPRVTMMGGAIKIETGDTLLGAIGVSGAPGGDKDEKCARAGLDAIRDRLDF